MELRGGGMRGAVVGAVVGGVLAVGVVVFLALTIGTGAVVVASLLALVPLAGLLLAVRWVDRWEPEPRAALWFAFAWGAGVAVVIALVFNSAATIGLLLAGLDEVSAQTTTAVLVAPVVEETAKGLGVLIVFLAWRRQVDGPVDGLVYAATVATGFAVVEDVLYFAQAHQYGDAEGTSVALVFALRALFSPFAHLMFTACIGLALGYAARRGGASWVWLFPLGWIGAVALHALWNGSAMLGDGTGFLVAYVFVQVPLFIGAIVLVVWLRKQEGLAVARGLAPYAGAGWFTAADLHMLSSLTRRKQARAWALRVRGTTAEQALREFQDAATALAYQRHRVEHRRVGHEGIADEQVLAARAAQARARVSELLGV
ncbi:MAG: PrsW family intramembrane metalloprotease [Actinomycetales bacterium]|nr:PrsW family intramembrane metalloprotease [Actinomycetales bacterium]